MPAFAEIYALTCPDSGEVRYIGKANDAAKRFATHMRDAKRRQTPVYAWIRKLQAQGKAPSMVVLAAAFDWPHVERVLIEQWRNCGARLLNLADGGNEPRCSAQVRAQNGRKVAADRVSSPVARRLAKLKQMLAQALREGYVSEATRAKMRAAAQRRPDLWGCWRAV